MSELKDHDLGRPGDLVVIAPHTIGGHEQLAEILEVLGEAGHTHYRVRWDEDGESIFFPGSDASIRRSRARSEA